MFSWHEDVALILFRLDLHDVEKVVREPYHGEGPGRPPRKPMGIFKALIVKRLRQIPSDRELYRRLWSDEELRMICDIEEEERPYHPSQLTRFRKRVGPERLEGIMNSLVEELVEGGVISGETVAMDATFVEAYSKRNPVDNSQGYSDPDARVGRNGKTYDLGYRAHIAADAGSDLPVAFITAPANDNEKKHARSICKHSRDSHQWCKRRPHGAIDREGATRTLQIHKVRETASLTETPFFIPCGLRLLI